MLLRVESSVQVNRVAGNAFRDEVAGRFQQENYDVPITDLRRHL